MRMGSRIALAMVATGALLISVAIYMQYGLVAGLTAAGIALVVGGPLVGVASSD
jgi:hypothetical protein